MSSILKQAAPKESVPVKRKTFTEELLTPVVEASKELNIPIADPDNANSLDLTESQKSFFNDAYKNSTTQLSLAIGAIESQFKNKIAPAIIGAARDREAYNTVQTGSLGMEASESTRAASYLANPAAVGAQQLNASLEERTQAILNAVNQGAISTNNITAQALSTEQSNIAQQFAKDQFLSEATGLLYNDGVNTGQELVSTTRYNESVERQEKADQFNRSITEADLKSKGYKVEIGENGDTIITEDPDSIVTINNRNRTLLEANAIQSQLDIQEQVKAANDSIFSSNQSGIAKSKAVYGGGFGIYYGVKNDENGVYVSDGDEGVEEIISTKGLVLNGSFNNTGFNNHDRDGEIAKKVETLIKDSVSKGFSDAYFNKIIIPGNKGTNKVTLMIANTGDNGARSYIFKEVTLPTVEGDPTETENLRSEMLSELTTIAADENTLTNMNKKLEEFNSQDKYKNTGFLYTQKEPLDFFKSMGNKGDYSESATRKIVNSDNIPNNRQLLAAMLIGTTSELNRGASKVLFSNKGEDITFNNAETIYNTKLSHAMMSVSADNTLGQQNTIDVENIASLYIGKDIEIGNITEEMKNNGYFNIGKESNGISHITLGTDSKDLIGDYLEIRKAINNKFKNNPNKREIVNEQMAAIINGTLSGQNTEDNIISIKSSKFLADVLAKIQGEEPYFIAPVTPVN